MAADLFKIMMADHVMSDEGHAVVVRLGEVVYIRPLEILIRRVEGKGNPCSNCPLPQGVLTWCRSIKIPDNRGCRMEAVKDGS